ncbi:hypothetical protein NQ117_09530 [Paenibacillus sp. SC116]|uniref:hypothetical protein n=1 Tax=Paenibacillus sp. SC116 TaxID=2968986 RepID=UPI00215A247B|nr:hypothetical protein [Paenibacillus sp. SC116]MCR8843928.1 hypothetical protein [Paenibacillus sp. SC116]
MPGIIQDNILFPILELVRSEVRKQQNIQNVQEGDPFAGTPSVALYRDHPADLDKLTGALLSYPSGYMLDLYLSFGLDPVEYEIYDNDPNWIFVTEQLLAEISIIVINPEQEAVKNEEIRLHYDNRWNLIGTSVKSDEG